MFLMGFATFSANVFANLDASRSSTNRVSFDVGKRALAFSLRTSLDVSSCADASLTTAKNNKSRTWQIVAHVVCRHLVRAAGRVSVINLISVYFGIYGLLGMLLKFS